jgi:hypothetical protein
MPQPSAHHFFLQIGSQIYDSSNLLWWFPAGREPRNAYILLLMTKNSFALFSTLTTKYHTRERSSSGHLQLLPCQQKCITSVLHGPLRKELFCIIRVKIDFFNSKIGYGRKENWGHHVLPQKSRKRTKYAFNCDLLITLDQTPLPGNTQDRVSSTQ